MKIAYILFDGITLLDFIGVYDPLSRLQSMKFMPDLAWDICATSSTIHDNLGLTIHCDKVINNLSEYDMVIVPGGYGTRAIQKDESFLNWLKTAEKVKYKVSICTGSLLLGAAGFLTNKRATTNFQEYQTLKKYCREVIEKRIVEDGNVITAGAVSSSIDLGLYLCEKFAGAHAREQIQARMDYPQMDIQVHSIK